MKETMKPRSLFGALMLSGVLVLAACGSSDGGSDTGGASAVTVEGADSSAPAPTTVPREPIEPPVATLPGDDVIPAEAAEAFAPVDVIGDPLPPFTGADPADDPAVGMPAPILIGYDLDGEPLKIDATTYGPTMVMFMAHWCPHCNDEIPTIQGLNRVDDLAGVDVVAVATGSNPNSANFPPIKWLRDKEWPFPAMLDGISQVGTNEEAGYVLTGMTAFGGEGFPFVVLIDGDGNVAARWSGSRTENEFRQLIATYLG